MLTTRQLMLSAPLSVVAAKNVLASYGKQASLITVKGINGHDEQWVTMNGERVARVVAGQVEPKDIAYALMYTKA